MLGSQRREAASLGANGIIVGDIKEPNAGTKIIGAVLGTGSERHGKALAIYIPADSDRVREACGKAPAPPQLAAERRAVAPAGQPAAPASRPPQAGEPVFLPGACRAASPPPTAAT